MKIKVGFSKHKDWNAVSELIKLAEHTPYSHAYIKIMSDSLDRTLIYQATGIGVYFVGDAAWSKSCEPVEEYEFEVSDEAKKGFLQDAIDKCGLKYSKTAVLGFLIQKIAALFGKQIPNPFPQGPGEFVCCTLVASALRDFGFQENEDVGQISLKELRDMVKAACEQATPVLTK